MAIAKKLTASAIASSLLLAIAGPAFAADQTVDSIANKMFDLGIIKGNGTDLNLDGTLTRAELVTTIVRSFGLENAAVLAKGAPSFADVSATEWYSGWVAVAKNLAEQKGLQLGVGNNNFNPNGQLSKAEALVFVMKFLGINVQATATGNWYDAWINEAVARGIITEAQGADIAATANAKSTRGEAFIVLDRGYSYKDANGKSLYTTNIDAVLPTLNLTPAATTTESEITLSGSVADNKGIASVVINGTAVTVTNGAFATKAALNVGKNEITVVVTDLAGNVLTKTYEIVRGNVDADSIQASDVTVAAGATATVEAKLVDKNGEAIADAAITGTSDLGTFENGVFTAGTKAGVGTLTLKSGEITKTVAVKVEAGALAQIQAATVAPNTVVTLNATDAYGNAISGATFAVKGSTKGYIDAAGNFFASEAGTYTVVATKGGASVEGTIGVYSTEIAGYAVSAPASVVANGTKEYTVTVKAVDAFGNVIPVADEDGLTVAIDSAFDLVDNAGATATFEDGVATFKFTADASLIGEEIAITVSNNGVEGSTKVNVVEQQATAVTVEFDGDYLTTNTTDEELPVAIKVVDQEGVAMEDGEWEIAISTTGPVKLVNGAGDEVTSLTWNAFTANDLRLVADEEAVTGAISVTATAQGLTAGSDKATAAVAQSAKNIKLTAGETTTFTATTVVADGVEYTVQITDKNGVPVKADQDLTLVVTGPTADDVTKSTISTVDGKATFNLAATKVGTYTVELKDAAETPVLTAAKSSFSVTAAAVAQVDLTSFSSLNVLRGAKNTVKYQLADAFGNSVAKAGVELTLTAGAGAKVNGAATAKVLTDANGVATAEVSVDVLTGSPTITVTSGVLTVADTTVTLNAKQQIANGVTVAVLHDADTAYNHAVTAGDTVVLKATVVDQAGYAMAGLTELTDAEGKDFTVTSGNVEIEGVEWTNNNDGTYTSSPIEVTKAGSMGFTVQVNNVAAEVKASTRNISVIAGALAELRIVGATQAVDETDVAIENTFDLTVEAGKANLITVQLTDEFGNLIKGTSNTTLQTIAFGSDLSKVTEFASFRDANGAELVGGLTIAANKVTGQFYLVTNTDKAGDAITLTLGATTYTFNLK